MYIDNIIKRQTITLIVIVITIVVFIFSASYILFFEIDNNYTASTSNFDIKFCTDRLCNNKYYNHNNIIGTYSINNRVMLKKINNYDNRLLAVLEEPYIFNIKNNSNDSIINLKLNFRKDYLKENTNLNYLNDILLAIRRSDDENIKISYYKDIDDYLLKDINIHKNEDITYYMWIWTENNSNNDNYFTASINIDIK